MNVKFHNINHSYFPCKVEKLEFQEKQVTWLGSHSELSGKERQQTHDSTVLATLFLFKNCY